MTANACVSGRSACELYWGWTYDEDTHFCVLQSWLYLTIPVIWVSIMAVMFVFVKFKLWVDRNVFIKGIKI